MTDLFRSKAGNATKILATMSHSLLGALLDVKKVQRIFCRRLISSIDRKRLYTKRVLAEEVTYPTF